MLNQWLDRRGDGTLPCPIARRHGELCSGPVAPSYVRHAKSPGLVAYVCELAATTDWSPALTHSALSSSPMCPSDVALAITLRLRLSTSPCSRLFSLSPHASR